jgi:hypothetical protein
MGIVLAVPFYFLSTGQSCRDLLLGLLQSFLNEITGFLDAALTD